MNILFKAHVLNEKALQEAKDLAEMFNNFKNIVDEMIGDKPNRYKELFDTHLELSSFYAKKRLAIHRSRQDEMGKVKD